VRNDRRRLFITHTFDIVLPEKYNYFHKRFFPFSPICNINTTFWKLNLPARGISTGHGGISSET